MVRQYMLLLCKRIYSGKQNEKMLHGKLTFKILKDDILNVTEGNAVRLTINGINVFYGFIFSKKVDKERNNYNSSI